MELTERGKEIYKRGKARLKDYGLWQEYMDDDLEMYAQSKEDWENAVMAARENDEVQVNEKTGTNQINAYHTLKKQYYTQVKLLGSKLFDKTKIEKPKKDKPKGGLL